MNRPDETAFVAIPTPSGTAYIMPCYVFAVFPSVEFAGNAMILTAHGGALLAAGSPADLIKIIAGEVPPAPDAGKPAPRIARKISPGGVIMP